MLQNPKTTILGYLVIAAAVVKVAIDYLSTGALSMTDLNSLLAAIGGAGLVAAKDGGH